MTPIKSNILKQLHQFTDQGYSKSELARQLEISRSTLIRILEDNKYIPSKSIENRILTNLSWLEKSHGHELLEGITMLYFQQPNVLDYFQKSIERAEDVTGFRVGYHGITYGGPVGFMFLHSPGTKPITQFVTEKPSLKVNFGRTETMLIGGSPRYQSNHEDARTFYEQANEPRVYLQFFNNSSFSSRKDLEKILEISELDKFKKNIMLLEAGLMTGEYDYFLLVMANNEQSFREFLSGDDGIYESTQNSLIDSITFPITPQGIRPLFTEDHYNLSFTPEQLKQFK